MSKKQSTWEMQVKKDGGLTSHWEKKISKLLVGKKITKVQYLSNDETEENYWCSRPIAIQLDNQYWLIPMSDDEGNDGGSMAVSFMKGLTTIPTLQINDKYLES